MLEVVNFMLQRFYGQVREAECFNIKQNFTFSFFCTLKMKQSSSLFIEKKIIAIFKYLNTRVTAT